MNWLFPYIYYLGVILIEGQEDENIICIYAIIAYYIPCA